MGKVQTDEHRKNISNAVNGRKHTEETRKKMSEWQIGKKLSEYTKHKISESHKGKNISEEHRTKLSEANKGYKNRSWKGGISSERNLLRGSTAYKNWRLNIFKRDNYICQICGKRGGDLNAHHIIHVSYDVNKALDLDNGITLCIECHKLEHPHLCGGSINER